MNKEILNPMFLTDFYKTLHHVIYVPNLEYLTSYWTPRKAISDALGNEVVTFGLQGFIKEYLIDLFNKNFFARDIEELVSEYTEFLSNTFNADIAKETQILRDLHELGYLPLKISALPEGTVVHTGIPMVEITNTVSGFAWLVNYLETIFSCNMWLPSCAATIARNFRLAANQAWRETCDEGSPRTFCCDFAMRGMASLDAAIKSASAHVLSFTGASTIPAYQYLEKYYNADSSDGKIARCSPSTEHSVMSSYGKDELGCYQHIIGLVPNGPLSIVSDTYDYWSLITYILPQLKDQIMNRNGKVLIRGDSGDPVDIVCGKEIEIYPDMKAWEASSAHCAYPNGIYVLIGGDYYVHQDGNIQKCVNDTVPPEIRGTVGCLWDIFGGTINHKGYKVLDKHIGALYGDGITLARAKEIWRRLAARGFAASNVGLGVGSFTYQYNTRDTFGFALKATHAIVNGEAKLIFKDPKTDNQSLKKSHKGLCKVIQDEVDGTFSCQDGFLVRDQEFYQGNALQPVFLNGQLLHETSLTQIRELLWDGNF